MQPCRQEKKKFSATYPLCPHHAPIPRYLQTTESNSARKDLRLNYRICQPPLWLKARAWVKAEAKLTFAVN